MYSKDSYRDLLRRARANGYSFIGFFDDSTEHDRCIYLRHDVDYSPELAVEMARINADLDVCATFSVLLKSHSYNLLSPASLECVEEICQRGQDVILHVAVPTSIPSPDEDLVELVQTDFETVRRYIPEIKPAFAWHNTTPELLRRGRALDVPGLTNVYDKKYVEDIPYYSDSNMRHSVDFFRAVIERERPPMLHLLFHPLFWMVEGEDVMEVFSETWKRIIRMAEQEVKANGIYGQVFPSGMPEEVLHRFSRLLMKENRKISS